MANEVQERFRHAVGAGDAVRLRRLLEAEPAARALIDEPLFPFDSPALVSVSGRPHAAVVEVLLAFGADPNRPSGWWAGGFHPLHVATPEAAERLLAAGAVPDACAAANLDRLDLLAAMLDADPARVHERGGDGKMPLHFARSRAGVDLLLDRGADIDGRDVDHRSTPAEWMLDQKRGAGRYDLAAYLVERGASCGVFLAAALGLVDRLASMLAEDPSLVGLRTAEGAYGLQGGRSSYHIYMWTIGPHLSPLRVAAQFEQPEALALLRAHANPSIRFLEACASGDAGEARSLLAEGSSLVEELTPMDHSALAHAAWLSEPEPVALMMELGFDPAAPGQDGGSALHCAAWVGCVDCVAAIVASERGRALLATRDPSHDGTPLDWCCHGASQPGRQAGPYAEIARLLLGAGAHPVPLYDDLPSPVRDAIETFGRNG